MKHTSNMFDYLSTGANVWRLGFETNSVIMLRMMGMAGFWNTPFDENWRMVAEKPKVFIKSGSDGLVAAMQGKDPAQVMDASIKRLNKATNANRKRLANRGPRKMH
ncbi:antifreeze protein [Dinoroseobacter sp. S76]|uniref:antifreeze protein n=1 Tax=Dinoroseobacter sp. S76 TaxID=3415124 RepID=UPI003C7A2522